MKTGPSQNKELGSLPMIVWDGLGLLNEYSGVGHYGAKLYKGLEPLGASPYVTCAGNDTPAFVSEQKRLKIGSEAQSHLHRRFVGLKPVYPLYSYQVAKTRFQSMIYHGLSNINLPCFGAKRADDRFVVTIHDIIPLLTAPTSALALQMKFLLPRVIDRADRIITGSNWAKESLVTYFGSATSDKIAALGYGSSFPTLPADKNEKTFDGLAIARGESYKRLDLILELAKRFPSAKFAVVTDLLGERIFIDAPSNLKIYRGLSTDQLDALMRSARVLLHPSLYEGWCLPAADALSQGLMLIYCGGSGIDEVAQLAPEQVVAMGRNDGVGRWSEVFSELIQAAPTALTAPRFPTWTEVSQKTLKIYQSLV